MNVVANAKKRTDARKAAKVIADVADDHRKKADKARWLSG
jgi:hypothetical protein